VYIYMSISDILTKSEVECIKKIYRGLIEDKRKVSSTTLAQSLGIKPPSVIDTLNKLVKKGLVIRKPWSYVKLTSKGLALAKEAIYHHRVLEQFYIDILRLEPDIACREADKIDYLIDCKIVSSLYTLLGRPMRCFHGNPIYTGYCGEKYEK